MSIYTIKNTTISYYQRQRYGLTFTEKLNTFRMLEHIFNTVSTDFTFSNSNLILQQIPIYLRFIGLKVIFIK